MSVKKLGCSELCFSAARSNSAVGAVYDPLPASQDRCPILANRFSARSSYVHVLLDVRARKLPGVDAGGGVVSLETAIESDEFSVRETSG